MKIANIIYEKELVNHTKVDYINYYNEVIEYDKLDKSLPTLYVGWIFMKSCNPENLLIQNANILNNCIISNELYWEYSFDEHKACHINGVEDFINLIPNYYFSPKYTYIDLDPIFFQIKDLDELMYVLPKKIDASYNLKNDILYILNGNKIVGINLVLYRYFKFNIDEILLRISERTTTSFNDLNGDIYQSYYKTLPNYINLKRYIIVLLAK
jgi:hypothetical protein